MIAYFFHLFSILMVVSVYSNNHQHLNRVAKKRNKTVCIGNRKIHTLGAVNSHTMFYTYFSSDKIYELVNNGLQDVNKIKDELHTFVEGEFSLGNSSFWLSKLGVFSLRCNKS